MQYAESTPFVTHPALHIRDVTDAHRVLEAVRLKILPLIKRRLVPHERAALRSGNVFVWEESEYEDGLVRWTEGRRWSQSKMRGDCLYYEEKIEATDAEKQAKAVRRALRASDSCNPIPMPPKRKDRPTKVDGLTKQTYSVVVQMPGGAGTRKWHVVAYFAAREASYLPVVEDYAYLRNIRIPDGVFLSSIRPQAGGGPFDWVPRPQEQSGRGSSSSSSSPQGSVSPVIRSNDPDSERSNFRPLTPHCDDSSPISLTLPPISYATSRITLPPLASLGCLSPRIPAGVRAAYEHPSSYSGVRSRPCYYGSPSTGSDDRRTLDRFRVVI
ncbi:Gti1/Pac2 family-domain-containing protein [Mycena polygramma]|nr:Gti1/Pac2 family-domain-containing protein [Mycena polygramma]